ncbi:nucleoside/nucleotide kinase family protein [Demequina activiva]|uniref:Nucleoside/nucleotide kinase family protein n=1 Tax=Demequina activiva TaxID=1582364 RepID=A0A919PZQ9_9MICO|nr:nucleoside/nucleotide kinase family protein [Demequina activiva]
MEAVSGFDQAVARARALADTGTRQVLGIVGAPGAGKSTLASALADAVDAVVVPMDGFHLAQRELERLGRADRKGAPDTFDASGFVALLRRLQTADAPVTYAPEFRREIEEPIAGAIAVPRDAPLVIVEGNYLLVDEPPWDQVPRLLDECWFVELDEHVRLDRLIARHEAHGRTPEQARAFAEGSDQANAALIAGTRERADWVIRLTD